MGVTPKCSLTYLPKNEVLGYRAGTCRMSDLLEAQLLYQQSCDKHTDAYADLQIRLLDYKLSTGQ